MPELLEKIAEQKRARRRSMRPQPSRPAAKAEKEAAKARTRPGKSRAAKSQQGAGRAARQSWPTWRAIRGDALPGRQHADIGAAVLAETAKLHAGDPENLRLWQEFLPACLDEIERIYRRLDVSVRPHAGRKLLSRPAGRRRRRFAQAAASPARARGRSACFCPATSAPLIVRKQDGAFLYATTDLATIQYRMRTSGSPTRFCTSSIIARACTSSSCSPRPGCGATTTSSSCTSLRHGAGRRRQAVQNPHRRHRRTGRPAGRSGRSGRTRSSAENDDAKPDGPRTVGRPSGSGGRGGRHRRDQIRRSVAEPHQRLRVQLRQDAGHERQHGHLHAICPRPGGQHFAKGQVDVDEPARARPRDLARHAGRAGAGPGALAIRRGARAWPWPTIGPII